VGIIPLKKGVIGNGVPSKACQLMAAKRVLLNVVEESDYTRLFESENAGVNVTDYNPDTVAEKIVWLSEHPEKCAEYGENAYRYSYAHYSRKENTAKFILKSTELQKKGILQ
jgi:colanic acid biosynthesis glycosyl transferase WcaI